MPNMFNVLYTRYIDQIKLQEIQNYNQKHRDYLLRARKLTDNPQSNKGKLNQKVSINQNAQVRATRSQISKNKYEQSDNSSKENNSKRRQFPTNKQKLNPTKFEDDRPLNQGNSKFAFTQYPEQPAFKNRQPDVKGQNYNIQKSSFKPRNQPLNQERAIKPSNQLKTISQQMAQYPQEQGTVALQECPEGCGRKFKLQTLQKHIKICQKVFQAKRKPFKVDVVDDQAKNIALKNQKNDSKGQKPKQQKIPKWKKQSEMLRRGLKSQEVNSSQSIPVEEEDERIQCKGCGRKFNEDAAKRHIESCMNRNKQKR